MGMLQLDGHAGNVGKRETVFAGKDALARMRHSFVTIARQFIRDKC